MGYLLTLLCAVIYLTQPTEQSVNVDPKVSINLTAINVDVNETQATTKDMLGKTLIICEDEDPTRAYIQTISPSYPCKTCFMLQKCGKSTSNHTEFCLLYLPTEGSLSNSITPMYTLTIGCTDDNETVATKTMTVTVIKNSPPVFSALPSKVTIDGNSAAGTSLFSAIATDINGDPISYTMSLSPSTPYLTIGKYDGIVQATHDLNYLCESSITATFKATDNINAQVVSKNVEFIINPHNTAPDITNLDTTVNINENKGVGATVYTLSVTDDKIGSKLTYHMTSQPGLGLELYELDTKTSPPKILTKINPNYERLDTQKVTLYIEVTDGYCSSTLYYLNVDVQNVNEPPTLVPSVVPQIDVVEGNVAAPTGVTLLDEDFDDTWAYSKVSGDKEFTIDPTTGYIMSVAAIDIDTKTPSKNYTLTYRATDKGGNVSNTVTVNIIVHDINDNAPNFTSYFYDFFISECTYLGAVIGNVKGTDDDSWYRSNDQIYYGGGGAKMIVMANGDVVLTQACLNGEIDSGKATIWDQGEYPRPLQGVPATISLRCGPCPTPTTPTPATTTKLVTITLATTTAAYVNISGSVGGSHGGIGDYLGWMIPAIIGGAIFLALLGYFIYRYCCPCTNPCAGRCVRKPDIPKTPINEPEPKPVKKEIPKKKLPPPPPPPPKLEVPAPPPPPPPAPEPKPEPYLFGFWKEQFTDQDHQAQPARAAKPQPIEKMPSAEVVPKGNAKPPENLKLGKP